MTLRMLLCVMACGGLAACAGLPRIGPRADTTPVVDLADLAANPGVYAGRRVQLIGYLSEDRGQACLHDRGARAAVRLTPAQAGLWNGAQDWPVAVEGVVSQSLCEGGVCAGLCAPFGLAPGARILSDGQER